MQELSFKVEFNKETFEAHYIKTYEAAEKVISQLLDQDVLFALDTETAALPQYKYLPEAALSPHLSDIRLLQIFNGKHSFVFDIHEIKDVSIFIPFLETKRFIAHNAVFDIQFLKKWGAKKLNIGCTFLLSKLLFHAAYPTDEGLSASLANMAKAVFETDVLKKMQASDWTVENLTFEQVEYAAIDAVVVLKLAEKLAPGLKKFGLERIYNLTKDAQDPITDMQLNGITLDIETHRKLISEWRTKLYAAKKEVLQITKLEYLTAHTLAEWLEHTLDSDVLTVWPRTEKGKLSTDSHTFADFSYLPIVKPFSEYQKQEKLVSSFGTNLIEMVNPATKRIHPSFRLLGARTGRLSCSSPNLQQCPRDSDMRSNFVASAGNVFVCADYSQIELRVAAELSRDEQMLLAYKEGIDLHALTASKISGKPLKSVTKSDRQMAKAFNFGLLFGLGQRKFSHYAKKSYGLEVSDEEASKSIKIFRETYSGYREWQLNQADTAAETLYCRTPCGKLRKLHSDNTYGTSMNHPVQGGAAEAMLYALIKLNNRLKKDSLGKLVNCVHDELMVECDEKAAEQVKKAIESSMVEGFLEVFPSGITRGICEVKSGKSWGEAKQ